MSSRPGRSRRDQPDDTGETARRQDEAATELSDRAAESVGRRYDATKEIHHGTREGPHGGGRPGEDPGDGE
ncbi:MAG TPA: hypothetical protein VF069_23265 [Streptosporangiaceae bacterium]